MDFIPDFGRTIMHCTEKLRMTPRPFNMMFDDFFSIFKSRKIGIDWENYVTFKTKKTQ